MQTTRPRWKIPTRIEDTNSYIQQIAQYLTGALSAEELIRALDTTVAMMVQENGG